MKFANSSREELLEELEALLSEKDDWASYAEMLDTELAMMRITARNSGYQQGYMDCLRHMRRVEK